MDLLHAHGINMRYIGRLAELAHGQEQSDRDLLLTNRHKIQSMPLFWLEMLEIEVLSRCFKHHLNSVFRSHEEIKQCPANTIASMLNHVLGTPSEQILQVIEIDEIAVKNGDKKKKKKSKGSFILSEEHTATSFVPVAPDASGSRESCLNSLQALARSRFCLAKFSLMFLKTAKVETDPATDSNLEKKKDISSALDERISRSTLLRRICQVQNTELDPISLLTPYFCQ